MFKHSLNPLKAYLKKLVNEAASGKGWQSAGQTYGCLMVFATHQHLPKATPLVIERFGFPVWRGIEEHGVEEEKNTDPARIPKCPGVR